jgi:hypothetical protein
MPRHDLQATDLRCPLRGCDRVLMRDECGIFCQGCGYEAVTWADPVDADVPMDVLVKREQISARRRSLRLAAAVAAALLLLTGIFWWSRPVSGAGASDGRDPMSVTMLEMREALQRRTLPAGVRVASYYRDPERFVASSERSAQTIYADWWRLRTSDEKLDLLYLCKDAESVELLPFLFEISWFTTVQEPDERVTRALLDALYLCSDTYVDVAIFVTNHVATTTTFPTASADARRYADHLVERRSRLGN